ncbi:gamma-glutamyltransferase family protein [Brevibacillus borstelensis]|uniref:gamma-glutamyltransferase family protein n=1 Tax=Brevibacillus borstelensis TaxID=45462 RepID=UPI0030BCA61A
MTFFNPMEYPYASRRVTTYARNGMVATSQPLAAQAGLDMLKRGGNAVDAAIATAACLTVVEPTSNGIGGDAYALVWTDGRLHGLNASGPAPGGISIEAVKAHGHEQMPTYGWLPVTVPGAPSAWVELSGKFGKLPLADVLQPAIAYAEQGYPLSPTLAHFWEAAYRKYMQLCTGREFAHWFTTFAPAGRPPRAGEIWRSPGHAETLRKIAETEGDSFYSGELAERIDAFSRECGGYLRLDDLAAYRPGWVKPISVNYRSYDVWEIPPNGQGLVALLALNMLKGYDFDARDSAETCHKQIEAIKLAFADGLHYITQADKMSVRVEDLLAEEYAAYRSSLIGNHAGIPESGKPVGSGTVYLATADGDGNMVSFIQSNYMGFGSGIVVPGTGIALQNRGNNFSLDPEHDNRLEPGKKSFNTIIPGFLTKDGKPVGPFGVMGGYMQPQGHVQVVMNTVDFQLNPQAALDAPRWRWVEGRTVEVEQHFPERIAQELERKGHEIRRVKGFGGFGRGQIIWRDDSGVLIGGTDMRTDSCIAAW